MEEERKCKKEKIKRGRNLSSITGSFLMELIVQCFHLFLFFAPEEML